MIIGITAEASSATIMTTVIMTAIFFNKALLLKNMVSLQYF